MIAKKVFALAAVAATLAFSQAAQAGPRLDKIMEAKVIRVGTPGDYRPFAIKTDAGYSGHDIDVIETMAKELGVKIEYVPTTWPNLVKDLQDDKFDVAVGGITRNVTGPASGKRVTQASSIVKLASGASQMVRRSITTYG